MEISVHGFETQFTASWAKMQSQGFTRAASWVEKVNSLNIVLRFLDISPSHSLSGNSYFVYWS